MKKAILIFILIFCLISSATLHTSANASNVFLKNRSAGKKIALTFDDGPHPIYTGRILEVLEEYGVKATFFVIGCNVENYPDAFKELLDSGCEIGNHTYSHKDIGKMSEKDVLYQLEKTEEAVSKFTDQKLSLCRPPEGSCGKALEAVSIEKGYDIILWSIDTLDWAHTPSERIANKILDSTCGGDIVLMHDYVSGGCQAPDALRIIIPKLLDEGYEFVTVSELIGEE
ncbi:MAG: chitooligosaccharide deacetylase [Ruminococcaceae bacterium]|nr:chitooligosaccharide deacetylase [Oscillospiraceae bacterium]